MGFLGFGTNYAKEGPGVDKDAPQKKRFFLFFEIYFRKFWKIVQLNLIYLPFLIPGAIGAFGWLVGGFNFLSLLLVLVSVVLVGPATAGITYVLRNFAREEHAFVFGDFKDAFKSNFKQAAITSTLFCAIYALIGLAVWFYQRMAGENTVMYLPLILSMATLMIVVFMNFYMYTMIVTFALNLRQMLKNALIFAIVGVFTNILTLFFVGAIALLMVLFFPITVIFLATIAFSTVWFIISFNVYPKIQKYMIDPFQEAKEEEGEEGEEEDPIFSDRRLIPEDDKDE